jgi:hypothetical protein
MWWLFTKEKTPRRLLGRCSSRLQRPGNQQISLAAAGRYSVDLCLSVQRNQIFDLFHACVIVQPERLIYKLKWLDQYRYLCAKIFRYPIKLHACNIFGLYFTTSNLYMQVQITTNNVVLREGILSVLLDEIKCRNCNCLSRFSVPSCV